MKPIEEADYEEFLDDLGIKAAPKIIYQNRIVAFIDVMGFKGMLSKNRCADLQAFYDIAFQQLEAKSAAFASRPQDEYKKLFVSDSILLSVLLPTGQSEKLECIANFFSSVGMLQYALAVKAKCWTRGGISAGDVFINDEKTILVGPAYVRAFELEKTARFPRIVIDPSVCNIVGLTPNRFIEEINGCSFIGKVIGPSRDTYIGRVTENLDALQVDWFSHAFFNRHPLTEFFEDLKARLVDSQDLFTKSRSLLGYMRESHTESIERKGVIKSRLAMVDSMLGSVGY